MPKVTADQIVKQGHHRNFVQWGGPRPGNALQYAGQDGQNMRISGVGKPIRGDIKGIYVPDPMRPNKFKMVSRTEGPPDLGTATLTFLERHGQVPRLLGREECPLNVYEVAGTCKDLSDFLAGWTDYVFIYSNGLLTDIKGGDRSAFDGDNQIEDEATVRWAEQYPIGGLSFGESAATQVDKEVVDIVYGSNYRCGDCGVPNDGSQWIYALTISSGGSPGLPAEVIYSTDGGATWSQVNVSTLGATSDPVAIDIVGDKLVVVGSGGAYHYATINNNTGVPGTWTQVTTGFVANKDPKDILVLSPREIYFVGDGGYIYKSTDITAGVSVSNAGVATAQNLKRIHGTDECIVAVGQTGAIVKSVNHGATWAATTTSPVALNTVGAVWVLDSLRYWVGSSIGRVYYTINGGETWTEQLYAGSGVGTIHDIVFASEEVGYFAAQSATPTASLYATWNGGANWTATSPRILNWPTFDYINRLAFPAVADLLVACNNIAAGGLAGNHADGIILLGKASVL